MTSLLLAALLQSVISIEAGLVNYVEGDVNVESGKNVAEGTPIQTGSPGYVELLLNPGSFLRLGSDSEAVIEDVRLASIRLRVTKGAAVVEASEIEEGYPITIISGNLETMIQDDGIYKFDDGLVTVVEGKLRLPNEMAYEKGWTVYLDRIYRAAPVSGEVTQTAVERWSANRAATLARANARAYQEVYQQRSLLGRSAFPSSHSWYYVAGLGSYIFLPFEYYDSPYGYNYRSISDMLYGPRQTATSRTGTSSSSGGGGGSGGGTAPPPPSPPPSDGGGGAPAPAPPVYRDIVPAKNGPATQQRN